jgi:hypothetical protein
VVAAKSCLTNNFISDMDDKIYILSLIVALIENHLLQPETGKKKGDLNRSDRPQERNRFSQSAVCSAA